MFYFMFFLTWLFTVLSLESYIFMRIARHEERYAIAATLRLLDAAFFIFALASASLSIRDTTSIAAVFVICTSEFTSSVVMVFLIHKLSGIPIVDR